MNLDKTKTRAAAMAHATKGRKTSFKSKAEAVNAAREQVAKQEITEAKAGAQASGDHYADPPKRMTDQEYAAQQDELLKDIPEEFKEPLSYMAYEQGHSSGYEEVINILRGLVSDLAEPIKKYGVRMSAK